MTLKQRIQDPLVIFGIMKNGIPNKEPSLSKAMGAAYNQGTSIATITNITEVRFTNAVRHGNNAEGISSVLGDVGLFLD